MRSRFREINVVGRQEKGEAESGEKVKVRLVRGYNLTVRFIRCLFRDSRQTFAPLLGVLFGMILSKCRLFDK